MLAHSFYGFYVVTKFILPTTNDLKFLTVNFDEHAIIYKRIMNVVSKIDNIFLIL